MRGGRAKTVAKKEGAGGTETEIRERSSANQPRARDGTIARIDAAWIKREKDSQRGVCENQRE